MRNGIVLGDNHELNLHARCFYHLFCKKNRYVKTRKAEMKETKKKCIKGKEVSRNEKCKDGKSKNEKVRTRKT